MSVFSGRGRVYLAVVSMLAWMIVLRTVGFAFVPPASISQSALAAGDIPLDRRQLFAWCLGSAGAVGIGSCLVVPLVRRHGRRGA